ncbi:MAG TPA: hypothetical protein DCW58_01830 [Candidatus Pacebacteria bacterium]|nr:hypothetical protein [Candidatus Paceibacterota bacterium]
MTTEQDRQLSISDSVLQAFTASNEPEISEASLIQICIQAKCPTRDAALDVLSDMVNRGQLKTRNVDGSWMYSKLMSSRTKRMLATFK